MKRIIIIILLAACLLPSTAFAATLTNTSISQICQADDSLYIFFDSVDENDIPISGLSADDIKLTVGNCSLKPRLMTVSEAKMGIGYVFAVDISRSLKEKQFKGVRDSLLQWISLMEEHDYAAIVTFGEEITILSEFTQNKGQLNGIVNKLSTTDSKTQLYNGIIKALDIAKRQEDGLPLQRVTVVLSDGIDDFPAGALLPEVSKKADDAGVPIYIIGFEAGRNKGSLNELGSIARLSGGGLHLAKADKISEGYNYIFNRIQSGYVALANVDYTVSNGSEQGLILSVINGGITLEDSEDFRLKALEPPATPTPEEPSTIPVIATLDEPLEEPRKIPVFVFYILGLLLAATIAFAFYYIFGQKKSDDHVSEKPDKNERSINLEAVVELSKVRSANRVKNDLENSGE